MLMHITCSWEGIVVQKVLWPTLEGRGPSGGSVLLKVDLRKSSWQSQARFSLFFFFSWQLEACGR